MHENERDANLPLPHLTGQILPSGTMPRIVRDARLLNILALIICSFGILAELLTLSNSQDRMETVGQLLFYAALGGFFFWHTLQLKRGASHAWSIQMILSCLGLFGFPLGTLIHGLVLSKWFTRETKAWFGQL